MIDGLKPYPKYKDSGVEWLGEVPEHWEVRQLKHLVRGKLKYGANEAAEFTNPTWPRYLRITDFRVDGELREDTFRSLPPEIAQDYLVQPGDILLARSGATVGKCFLVPDSVESACHAGYLIRVRPDLSLVLPKFMFAFFRSQAFSEWRAATFIISTIENISAEKYAVLHLPLPPLPEQTAIVEFLDEQTEKIEAAIAADRRVIDLLQEFRTRLIADVVTGKVDVREVAAKLPDLSACDAQAGEPLEEETETLGNAGVLDDIAEEYLEDVSKGGEA